jgi:hypothetical protein
MGCMETRFSPVPTDASKREERRSDLRSSVQAARPVLGRPGGPRLPVEQLGQRKRNREQYRRDRERVKFGTQGAASDVRKIDVVSVDTAQRRVTRGRCCKHTRAFAVVIDAKCMIFCRRVQFGAGTLALSAASDFDPLPRQKEVLVKLGISLPNSHAYLITMTFPDHRNELPRLNDRRRKAVG